MKTYQKVYNLVKKIPKGKVMTYGQIGQILDLNPMVVGWALNRLAKVNCVSYTVYRKKTNSKHDLRTTIHEGRIPWQRVINSKGTISTNKLMNIPLDLQKKLLEKEGVVFDKKEKIDLKKYLFTEISLVEVI